MAGNKQNKAEALALNVAGRLKTGERVKLKSNQITQLFTSEVKDASATVKKITDMEKDFLSQFPACTTCDGIQATQAGSTAHFVSYPASGIKALKEAGKCFDRLRTIATDLANKKAKFLKPGPLLVQAMQSAGVKGAGGKKSKRK